MAPIQHQRSHPRYRIHLEDLGNAATCEFARLTGLGECLHEASEQVFRYLYEDHGTPQAVRSVTLIVESMGGVAYTTGIPIDDLHKEIHLSQEYLTHCMNDTDRFHDECIGVLTHEMVHCWQHNCSGTAPGGLIEGIADFVRLKAGLAPPHWKKTKEECGKHWDEGYQKTAFFLEWLENQYGTGSISKMNAHMHSKPYDEEKFWHTLFGESIDTLWARYLKHWDEGDSRKPPSIASTEPELVDLTEEEKAAADGDANEREGKQAKEFHA